MKTLIRIAAALVLLALVAGGSLYAQPVPLWYTQGDTLKATITKQWLTFGKVAMNRDGRIYSNGMLIAFGSSQTYTSQFRFTNTSSYFAGDTAYFNHYLGNGVGLMSLNASNITSGTVGSAYINGNYSSQTRWLNVANDYFGDTVNVNYLIGNGAGITSILHPSDTASLLLGKIRASEIYIANGQATASLGGLVPALPSGQHGWLKYNANAPESGTLRTAGAADTLDWQANMLPPVPLDMSAVDVTRQASAVFDGIGATRAVVSLRFDDGTKLDSSFTFRQLVSRKLVGGFAIIANSIGTAGNLTYADLQNMQLSGMEIMDHSYSHATASSYNLADFLKEVKDSKDSLEAHSLFVQHFVAPGSWSGELLLNTEAKARNKYATMIKSIYSTSSAYLATNEYTGLPAARKHFVGHRPGYSFTVAQNLTEVDNAINGGYAVDLLFHSADFGIGGNIDTTNFKKFLDSLKVRVDSGLVKVLTPTGSLYAKYGTASTNYLYDGNFELSQTGSWKGWQAVGVPKDTAAGITGNCAETGPSNYLLAYFPGNSFRTVRFVGYAKRAYGISNAEVHVGSTSELFLNYTTLNASTWTKIEFTFTIPPLTTTSTFYISLRPSSTGWVLWDNLSLTKE
jgi:hypothetical protein